MNANGRVEITTLPDGKKTTNEFFLTGELKRQSGSRTYLAEYTYEQGRIKTMKTWTNAAAGNYATTTWNYSTDRGFLTSKTYNDNKGPSYTYYDSGRLKTRAWYRGVTTTYTYLLGDLYTVDYSDTQASPDITYTYNRRGKSMTIVDQTGTHVIAYDNSGMVDYENNTSGILSDIKVDHHYDSYLRRDYVEVQKSSVSQFRHEYGYDEASRLKKVFQGNNYAIYGYEPNSPLIQTITFKNNGENGSAVLTATKGYDKINRLTSISSVGQSTVSFTYGYNSANQRASATLQDSSHWDYQYDNLGQVTSGKHYWSDNMPVAGQQFEYTFDDIGNRRRTKQGGDNYGVNLRTANYTPNLLNQYTSRTVPGYIDVMGSAASDSTVTVDDNPSQRKSTYFRTEIPVDNSSAGISRDVTVRAVKFDGTHDVMTTASRTFFVPPVSESLTYDDDGNLTSDGRWTYSWDAENRLTNMAAKAYGLANSARKQLGFSYDYMGRRVLKVVSTWNGTAYANPVTTRFVYDGSNLLAELDADNGNAVKCSYMWGLDLSGSMQGAGGVGGLLTVSPGGATTHFVSYDGNGNVAALTDSTGNISARYEYDPFGQTLRASGSAAALSFVRNSTKLTDSESSLCYYGYRLYNSSAGRWLNRDPAGEIGGANLLCLIPNDPIDFLDRLGQDPLGGYYAVLASTPQAPAPITLPTRRPEVPEQFRSCCDDDTIQAGEKQLNGRFAAATFRASTLGLRPAPVGDCGPTCKNSSVDIIEWLAPYPKCWVCYLELRERRFFLTLYDHQVVICSAYGKTGLKKEIFFDWWGDQRYGRSQSGGPADQFRARWPISPRVIPSIYSSSLTTPGGSTVGPIPQNPGFDASTAPNQVPQIRP